MLTTICRRTYVRGHYLAAGFADVSQQLYCRLRPAAEAQPRGRYLV